jgi:hypothetical protein
MTVFTNKSVSDKEITRKAAKSQFSRISAVDSAKLVCERRCFLQSTNKQRKYQRRGSKCPSMLLLNTVRVSKYIEDLESRPIVEEKNHLLTLLTEALSLSSSSDALA